LKSVARNASLAGDQPAQMGIIPSRVLGLRRYPSTIDRLRSYGALP